MEVKASITSDNATPAIAEIMAKTAPDRLARVCRQPLETFWRVHLAHFPRLEGAFANFPSTGFGESSSRSVTGTVEGTGVRLAADQLGLNLRYRGGTIHAVNKKMLCFGIAPESYGKTVYDFGYQKGKKDKALSEKLRQLFAFARQVTFRPNPRVVPEGDEFQEVAMGAIQRSLA